MRAFISCYKGADYELPPATGWRMNYGTGTPCDSFEMTCPWGLAPVGALTSANRFWAEEKGQRVFTGVVDEYACSWDETGGHLTLSGRGMAALLLDNEARAAEYQLACLDDILQNHVLPYGISVVAGGRLPAVPAFTVGAGQSEWQVLYDFARYHGGVEPRFDRWGGLVLAPWPEGGVKCLDDKTPITAAELRERRYGVVTEVLVENGAGQTAQRVVNEAQRDRGGQCRRVITQPARAGYQAMRYRGQYQLERSAQARIVLEVTVPEPFLLWPGDLVELQRQKPRLTGLWRVQTVETGGNENGTYSRVTLGET